jgi:effector-binding domain-containing protein
MLNNFPLWLGLDCPRISRGLPNPSHILPDLAIQQEQRGKLFNPRYLSVNPRNPCTGFTPNFEEPGLLLLSESEAHMKILPFPPEIGAPGIEYRPARQYIGLRIVTPFEGMFAQTDKLFKELRQWVNTRALADQGPYFLRYHAIDMQGLMDVEAGFVVASQSIEDERVKGGTLPAGRYAHLTYSRYALRGNQALLIWIKAQQLEADRAETAQGDAFGCRYEAYLTDYRMEHRKSKWQVDLAIRLRD